MATAKHKNQKLSLNPANHNVFDVLHALQRLPKKLLWRNCYAIIEFYKNARKSPHLKKSINQAHLGKSPREQKVTLLERELELNGLEPPVELHVNPVSQHATSANTERPKTTCQ